MVLYRWLNKRRLEAAREEGYREGLLLGMREALEEERRWLELATARLIEDQKRLREWYANLPPESKEKVPPPF